MAAIGYLQVHAYTSKAQIPLKDVAVMVTDTDNNAIALRLTDRSGKIPPISLEVPDRQTSQSPGTATPFRTINIFARLENYETIAAYNVQVFPDTVTAQNLELIPLSELPSRWSETEEFDTPAQNL